MTSNQNSSQRRIIEGNRNISMFSPQHRHTVVMGHEADVFRPKYTHLSWKEWFHFRGPKQVFVTLRLSLIRKGKVRLRKTGWTPFSFLFFFWVPL